MRTLIKQGKALLCCLLFILPLSSFAATLQEAKASGLVGEKTDGYVGFVVSNVPSELRDLVNNVNQQRKAAYERVATQNNLTVQQVASLAFEKAKENTRPGHYLQTGSGSWVKK